MSSPPPSKLGDSSSQTCPLHNTKLSVVCLDCRVKICYECGLFGGHKEHLMEPEAEFFNRTSQLYSALKAEHKAVAKAEVGLKKGVYKLKMAPSIAEAEASAGLKIEGAIEELKAKVEGLRGIILAQKNRFFEDLELKCKTWTETVAFEESLQSWKRETRKAIDDFFENQGEVDAGFALRDVEKKEGFMEEGRKLVRRLTAAAETAQNRLNETLAGVFVEPRLLLASDIVNVKFPSLENEPLNPSTLNPSTLLLQNSSSSQPLIPQISAFQSGGLIPQSSASQLLVPPSLDSSFVRGSPSTPSKSLIRQNPNAFTSLHSRGVNEGRRGSLFRVDPLDKNRTASLSKEICPRPPTSPAPLDPTAKKNLSSKTGYYDLERGRATQVDLTFSGLGDKEIASLGPLLANCRPLQTLVLAKNRISIEGLRSLLASLSASQIARLDLSFNHLARDSADLLLLYCRNNRALKWLALKGNRFDPSDKKSAVDEFKSLGVSVEF